MIIEHNDADRQLAKVQFYDPVTGYENLWALPLDGDLYQIESIPFFIYDLALADVVRATEGENKLLQFVTVVKRSGNRTLRARSDYLIADAASRSIIAMELERMGCIAEIHRDRLLSINIPSGAAIADIATYLTKMRLAWEYGCPSNLNR